MPDDRKQRVVVLCGGGVKSATAAMREIGPAECHLLYVDDGAASAKRERQAVTELAAGIAAKVHVVELRRATPDGSAQDATGAVKKVSGKALGKSSHLAGRVLTWFGVAQSLALRLGADRIVTGISQRCDEEERGVGPREGDPAARHAFLHTVEMAVELSSPVRRVMVVDAPFMEASLEKIIRTGLKMGAPLHLAWSCRLDGESPCAECAGCRRRHAAFEQIGMNDPAQAAARTH